MSVTRYGNIQKMTVALLTAFVLAFCQPLWALATSVENVSVRSAPMQSENITANGMVRVYLSSLGNPETLDITVRGRYSLSTTGEFFANGSQLQVRFSPSNGSLTLVSNGQSRNMGSGFSLRRHSAEGENGLLIAQSRDSQNPYPGDLSFEVVYEAGGYTLYTVAHIYIENYLYGVLPYEMGNSSGLEALKAQAVAARTYTVRMMKMRASGRYDVKDTTSDQVYRGTPGGNANCVAAVDATKGIVLMYGSDYITTYYSASNGGQTETSRSGSSFAYMKVKDDPFDYANPSSTVKKKTVYADLNASSNPAELIALLKSKAVTALQRKGFPANSMNTTLGTLQEITPHTPMYASPSRLYTQMDFTFTAYTPNGSGLQVLSAVTVTCDIFGELEALLGLGIQSMNNELWTVEKSSGSFSIQARRYGHGMGMSQRGAMYMAKLGYAYDEILGFYFEGCKRVRHSFSNTILSASSSDQEITIEPPAELENSADANGTGRVMLAGNTELLTLHASPSSASAANGLVPNGAKVEVLMENGGWYLIRYGQLVGYAPKASLSVTGTPSGNALAVSQVIGFATVTANDYVNLRASASTSAAIMGTAPAGAKVTVISQSGSWAKVQYNATCAYVNTNYLSSVTAPAPEESAPSVMRRAVVTTQSGFGTVNLRAAASTSSAVLCEVAAGTAVDVLSENGTWSYLSVNGTQGYMLSRYLTAEGSSSGEEEDVPGTDMPAASCARVATSSGALNLRLQAHQSSAVLLAIPKGALVEVLARGGEWTAVRYNASQGYVMTKYLAFIEEESEPVQGESAVVVTPSGTLNLRLLPTTASSVVASLQPGSVVTVWERGNEWSRVQYGSLSGYVMTRYLRFGEDDAPAEPPRQETPTAPSSKAYVKTQSGALNLRAQPDITSVVLACVPQNAMVEVTAYGDSWCAVRYGAYDGYVMTAYLAFEQAQQPSNVWVVTSGDALNLRSAPSGTAPILAFIPCNTQVKRLEAGAEWSKIVYGTVEGYAASRFLSETLPTSGGTVTPSQPPQTEEEQKEYVTIGGQILDITLYAPEYAQFAYTAKPAPLYDMCSEKEGARMTIPADAEVEVLLLGVNWCRVAYGDEQGYCKTNDLMVR